MFHLETIDKNSPEHHEGPELLLFTKVWMSEKSNETLKSPSEKETVTLNNLYLWKENGVSALRLYIFLILDQLLFLQFYYSSWYKLA